MSASKAARAAGLNSLNELAELTNCSRQTLHNHFKGNRIKFDCLLYGAVVRKLNKLNEALRGIE